MALADNNEVELADRLIKRRIVDVLAQVFESFKDDPFIRDGLLRSPLEMGALRKCKRLIQAVARFGNEGKELLMSKPLEPSELGCRVAQALAKATGDERYQCSDCGTPVGEDAGDYGWQCDCMRDLPCPYCGKILPFLSDFQFTCPHAFVLSSEEAGWLADDDEFASVLEGLKKVVKAESIDGHLLEKACREVLGAAAELDNRGKYFSFSQIADEFVWLNLNSCMAISESGPILSRFLEQFSCPIPPMRGRNNGNPWTWSPSDASPDDALGTVRFTMGRRSRGRFC